MRSLPIKIQIKLFVMYIECSCFNLATISWNWYQLTVLNSSEPVSPVSVFLYSTFNLRGGPSSTSSTFVGTVFRTNLTL